VPVLSFFQQSAAVDIPSRYLLDSIQTNRYQKRHQSAPKPLGVAGTTPAKLRGVALHCTARPCCWCCDGCIDQN